MKNMNNREIIRLLHEKLNQGDLETSLEYIAPDAFNHGMKVGREGFRMVLEDIYATFPDWNFEIAEMVEAGDTVVVRTNISATHLGRGEFPVNGGMLVGVEPTGKSFEVQHIHWYKLRDRMIVDHYATRDDLGMMQQLGRVPSGGEDIGG